jgi:phosphopantetheine--protein transferase-like protein
MDTTAAAQFLGNLINQPVEVSTTLRLSSAQRARFLAWLHAQGQSLPDAAIKGAFSLAGLAGQSVTSPVPLAPTTSTSNFSNNPSAPAAVGIDIQSVSELTARVNVSDLKADTSLTALFTARELSYAQARQQPLETLAGLWAAKEAMRKCLGGPDLPLEQLRSMEVLPDEHGRPVSAGFSLSISHSAGLAVAVAVRGGTTAVEPATGTASGGALSMLAMPAAQRPTSAARLWQAAVLLAMAVLISLHVVLLTGHAH